MTKIYTNSKAWLAQQHMTAHNKDDQGLQRITEYLDLALEYYEKAHSNPVSPVTPESRWVSSLWAAAHVRDDWHVSEYLVRCAYDACWNEYSVVTGWAWDAALAAGWKRTGRTEKEVDLYCNWDHNSDGYPIDFKDKGTWIIRSTNEDL